MHKGQNIFNLPESQEKKYQQYKEVFAQWVEVLRRDCGCCDIHAFSAIADITDTRQCVEGLIVAWGLHRITSDEFSVSIDSLITMMKTEMKKLDDENEFDHALDTPYRQPPARA